MAIAPRIVSLLPSSTEMLCALQLEASLVGISHRCDYPTTITQLPRVTTPPRVAFPVVAHEATALLQTGLGADPIDLVLLRQLQPDLVITQTPDATAQGVRPEVLDASRRFLGAHVEVISLQPTFLQDIWDDIYRLGEATGHTRQAATLLEELFARVNTVVAESIMLHQPPRVAVLTCCQPLRLAGYWLPDLLRLAGGTVGLSTAGAPGPDISWEQLLDYAPEVLLVMPYDANLEHSRLIASALQAHPAGSTLPALQQGHAYAVEGRALLHRPGPRIVEGLELLAGLIHPDLFGELAEPHQQAYDTLPA